MTPLDYLKLAAALLFVVVVTAAILDLSDRRGR
jgi:hypothetical protein